MALRVLCQWLVYREDVAKWAPLFMACKGTLELARPKLEVERWHKVLVVDDAFEGLAKELHHLSFPTMVVRRMGDHVWNMRRLVNEVKVLSMNRKLDAVPYIGDEIKEALTYMMRDVDELTDYGYTHVVGDDICANAERLSDLKRAWRIFKADLALRRVPTAGGPARP